MNLLIIYCGCKKLDQESLIPRVLTVIAGLIISIGVQFTVFAVGRIPQWMTTDLQEVGISTDSVAVYVKDASSGLVIANNNATTPFKPASIIKVLTTFAALDILGEQYRWHTPVYVTAQAQKGELRGDLIFRGVGDPSLSHAKLGEFSTTLLQRGIKVIRGDVILDKSYFASTVGMSEQFHGEVDNPIHLPPQPLLVSGKFVTVAVSSEKNSGTARVSVQPSLPGVTIVNGVTVAPGPCTRPKDGVSVNVTGNARQATINLGGTLAEACGVFSKKVSVLSADGYFAASFKRSFEQLGGRIDGQIRDGTTAARSKLFGSIESDALIEIIRETNKTSNNLMARQIFLTIGSELTGEPPSPSRAASAIRKWIADRVPDTAPFVLENGSGLSDYERVTAKGMVSLLDYIRKSQHAAAFLETMPAVGEDGTMRNRLKDNDVAGKSVAKTGTLRDTAAIAGLVLTKRGRTFIFCMIVNSSNIAAGRKVIDRLIAWLHSPDVDA